jgi:hypothetical protein
MSITGSLRTAFLSRLLGPKVKHRLPGRLRLSVPLLKRVPRDGEPLADKLEKLFLLPEGIQTVSVSFLSGSLLIGYNTRAMSEQQVLEWTDTLWRLLGEHYDRLASLPVADVDTVVARIEPLLQNALNENHSYNKRIVVPDDVWA